jgi:hypothetical protein
MKVSNFASADVNSRTQDVRVGSYQFYTPVGAANLDNGVTRACSPRSRGELIQMLQDRVLEGHCHTQNRKGSE